MKIDFDDILTGVLMALGVLVSCIPIVAIAWFIYKIAAGAYHLLDKLIDKI